MLIVPPADPRIQKEISIRDAGRNPSGSVPITLSCAISFELAKDRFMTTSPFCFLYIELFVNMLIPEASATVYPFGLSAVAMGRHPRQRP